MNDTRNKILLLATFPVLLLIFILAPGPRKEVNDIPQDMIQVICYSGGKEILNDQTTEINSLSPMGNNLSFIAQHKHGLNTRVNVSGDCVVRTVNNK